MSRQYPYSLYVKSASGGVWDGQGNPVESVGGWSRISDCRDEVDTKGGKKQLADGETYSYSSLVLLPKSSLIVEVGTSVEIRDGDYVRVSGEVQMFDKGRLHSRLWL